MNPVETPCVCTTLRMATRSVARRYDHALAAVGIRQVTYTILARLDADGPLSVNELAERLCLDRTTCSREITPLVARGLVETQRGEDRRRRMHRVSSQGLETLQRARPYWHQVQQQIEREFGGAETGKLLASLRSLLHVSESLQTPSPHL